VARSNPRLVVGVGVVSAFLLVGGPGLAAAIADPDHSGRSDRDNSDRNWGESGGGSKRGDDDPDDRGDRGDRYGGGGDNRTSDDGFRVGDDAPSFGNGPQTRVGSGRTEIQEVTPEDDSGSNDRSGSDHPGASPGQFEPPRVTVGNGRTPGVQDNDREPRFRVSAPEPAPAPLPPPPPPPPPAPPKPSWTDRIYTPPVIPKQLSVTPTADWTEPLWGVAGLLLIPAAGAVVGYRQARAAQDVEKLRRP
jgi:hypothetical protein